MNFEKIYNSLINKAQLRESVLDYYEKHHIIPKCINGTNDKSNLVKLSAREHYLAHKLLYKMYPDNRGICLAWHMMGHVTLNDKHKRDYNITSREFEKLRVAMSNNLKGKNNPFYGKKHSKETKLKISNSRKSKCTGDSNNSRTDKFRESVTGKNNPQYGKVGKLNHKSVNIEVDDVIYKGIRDTARLLGISYSTLNYRLKSSKFTKYKILEV